MSQETSLDRRICIDAEASVFRMFLSWITTVRPASLARRHLSLIGWFVTAGTLAALALRAELLTPPLDLMEARTFGALLTFHGALSFYFVALPAFPAILGYTLLPRLAGVRIAWPGMAAVAWLLLVAGGATLLLGFATGGTEAGWTFDAGYGGRFDQPGMVPLCIGVTLAAASFLLTTINCLASVYTSLRTASANGGRHPLALAYLYASVIGLAAGITLIICVAVVAADSIFHWPVLSHDAGRDPRIFAFLFRIFKATAQSMLLLFAMGTTAAIVGSRVRDPGAGRLIKHILAYVAAITLFGWIYESATASDLRTSGEGLMSFINTPLFAAMVLLVVQVARMLKSGLQRLDTAFVYACGFLVTAVAASGAGASLSVPTLGRALNTSTFATAQMHLMALAVLGMAFMAGLHEAWPVLTGRRFSESLGRFAALIVLAGTHFAFLPMLILGIRGSSFRANAYPPEFQVANVLSTLGSTILLVGLLIAGANLVFGRRVESTGERAESNKVTIHEYTPT